MHVTEKEFMNKEVNNDGNKKNPKDLDAYLFNALLFTVIIIFPITLATLTYMFWS